ncbi:hypothetical protein BGZ99_007692 [Dissophora globulifera]|uniref:Urea active transporter n=1 Tax=Dissophora globulifera TaxID=979702 RepID=A0A9P6RCS3_9FUNG|nr:hypothetical protein BGZ99_007692 [Dissophora globulifera]
MAILSEGLGYGIILGFGLVFAAIMTLITMIQKRFLNEKVTSEEYMAAGRSVKTGLVASAVVSSWTWAATLLQSSSVAYKYGISGPFWYASGACVQVLLFSVLAIELKRKCPNAHTFLEIISIRYGRQAHFVLLFFGLLTNIIVSAMLLLGGSAVVTTLTGVNTIAACFLLPVGVIIYTLFGGLKATFVADYSHTVVIMVIVLLFSFTAYTTSDLIGSPGKMYDLLQQASAMHPVSGNHEGSYLTMASSQGLMFGIINLCSNFGTVFIDNAYWQRAIAASPHSTVKAYLIGGLSWFAIPFTLATTLGISAVALESNERFPTFPNRLLPSDVSAGLVAPNAAVALLGHGGAVAVLLLVFMAVTSAASAELIAVSSVCTFDIYRTYINPMATGKQLISVSHAVVGGFGVLMGVLAVILKEAGIDLGYLYSLMGVLISSAVLPVTFSLLWKKQSALAACVAPIGGLCVSITAWLVCAKIYTGEITLASTGSDQAMLAGNLAALISGGVISAAISFIKPDNYTFEGTRSLRQVANDGVNTPESNSSSDDLARIEKKAAKESISLQVTTPKEGWGIDVEEDAKLAKAARFARWSSGILTVVLILVWPLPMFFSNYVFSRGFYTGWVVLSIVWAICSAVAVTLYPLWESRAAIRQVFKGIYQYANQKPSTTAV